MSAAMQFGTADYADLMGLRGPERAYDAWWGGDPMPGGGITTEDEGAFPLPQRTRTAVDEPDGGPNDDEADEDDDFTVDDKARP